MEELIQRMRTVAEQVEERRERLRANIDRARKQGLSEAVLEGIEVGYDEGVFWQGQAQTAKDLAGAVKALTFAEGVLHGTRAILWNIDKVKLGYKPEN